MPDVSGAVRADIEERLARYIESKGGYTNPVFVGSGGSAAIFCVDTPYGPRAIKVYDPKFLSEDNAKAEGRRLALQTTLIGHECPTLVKLFGVEVAHETAFIEMEYVDWPQLKKVLRDVPDESVAPLITQLVDAVVFLEKLDIAHRDVKPENIHVSPDFKELKLIDLGVSRAIAPIEGDSNDGTDHGNKRPFIATAQYSSPEYLFRLDAPSASLWRALNLYQVGAVLHDLINKRPIFADEVELENRWLVARAVLSKVPNFPDTEPSRLARLKALATRCLAKDMETRLQIVSWSDFSVEAGTDSLSALRNRVAKNRGLAGVQSAVAVDERLRFEREKFSKWFFDEIRNELVAACDRAISVRKIASEPGSPLGCRFELDLDQRVRMLANLRLAWFDDMNKNSASVVLSSILLISDLPMQGVEEFPVAVATLGESEDVVALDVSGILAGLLVHAMDLVDTVSDLSVLHGTDLGAILQRKG